MPHLQLVVVVVPALDEVDLDDFVLGATEADIALRGGLEWSTSSTGLQTVKQREPI